MRRKGEKGFTLIEITIILLVLVILAAILLPMAERYIDLARLARVREDVGALASAIEMYKFDTCERWFKVVGDNRTLVDNVTTAQNRVDMLIGDGDTPDTTSVTVWGTAYSGDGLAKGNTIQVDTIENQLALGRPFKTNTAYPTPDLAVGGTPPATGISNPFRCGYRGAYLQTPIQADPWGNRYMINVAFLGYPGTKFAAYGAANANDFNNGDTFVLSAGPDEAVSTQFFNVGVIAQGDDQIAVVSGSGAKL